MANFLLYTKTEFSSLSFDICPHASCRQQASVLLFVCSGTSVTLTCFWDTGFTWVHICFKDICNSWWYLSTCWSLKEDEMVFFFFFFNFSLYSSVVPPLQTHHCFFSLLRVVLLVFMVLSVSLHWSVLCYFCLHLWPYSSSALRGQVRGSWVCTVCYHSGSTGSQKNHLQALFGSHRECAPTSECSKRI